jgi:hypothetical protein
VSKCQAIEHSDCGQARQVNYIRELMQSLIDGGVVVFARTGDRRVNHCIGNRHGEFTFKWTDIVIRNPAIEYDTPSLSLSSLFPYFDLTRILPSSDRPISPPLLSTPHSNVRGLRIVDADFRPRTKRWITLIECKVEIASMSQKSPTMGGIVLSRLFRENKIYRWHK